MKQAHTQKQFVLTLAPKAIALVSICMNVRVILGNGHFAGKHSR